jgi:ribosomal protein S18 acetylase RimI-like enzyme
MRIEVRLYEKRDREAVLALAPRLVEGVAPWRPAEAVRPAVVGWVVEALARSTEPGRFVYVAEVDGEVVGFLSGEERAHWSGELDLYVGELVVAPESEGKGVGRSLMAAVTEYAKQHGIHRITMETGAANEAARAFYQRLGFAPEDVRLTKLL